jgi:signal transduction histidine kinase
MYEGAGIAGMRERAQSLGGSLEAGPVDGGYLVSVLLPTARDSTARDPAAGHPTVKTGKEEKP